MRSTPQITYKDGYKYQLKDTAVFYTSVCPENIINTPFIQLSLDGVMVVKRGYAWDGATFFPDFDWIIRGSMVHDALLQLMREGLLPQDKEIKRLVDLELKKCCIEDGSGKFMAQIVFFGVQNLGKWGGSPEYARPIKFAPAKG